MLHDYVGLGRHHHHGHHGDHGGGWGFNPYMSWGYRYPSLVEYQIYQSAIPATPCYFKTLQGELRNDPTTTAAQCIAMGGSLSPQTSPQTKAIKGFGAATTDTAATGISSWSKAGLLFAGLALGFMWLSKPGKRRRSKKAPGKTAPAKRGKKAPAKRSKGGKFTF